MVCLEKEKRVLTAFIYRPIKTDMLTFINQIGIDNKMSLEEVSKIILTSSNVNLVNGNYLNDSTKYKGGNSHVKKIYEQRCHSYFMEIVFKRYYDCLLKKEHNLFIHDIMGCTLSINKVKSNDMLISDFCKNYFSNIIKEVLLNYNSKLVSNYKDIIVTILNPNVPMYNKKIYLNRYSSKDVKIIQEIVEQFLTDFIVYVARRLDNNNLQVFVRYTDSLKNMITGFYTKRNIEEVNKNVKVEEQIVDPDSLVVETMLASGLFRLDWARRFYGSIDKFNGSVNRLKNKNPLLYERCQEEFSKEKELASKLVDTICYFLENKIKLEDGSYRDFTIIDYYSLTTLSIESLNIMIRGMIIDYNKSKLLKDFINSNLRGSYINEKDALAINFFMNIGSEKRNLLLEEKKALINYMNENGIPMRTETYSSLVNEYGRGRILVPHNK